MKFISRIVGNKFNYCEIFVYFSIYIIYILYGLLAIYQVRDKILQISSFEFAKGWEIFDRPRDNTNDELEIFNEFVHNWWHWYLFHIFIVTIVRVSRTEHQSLSHAAVCIVALLYTLHHLSILIIAVLLFTFYIIAEKESIRLTWCLAGIWMLIINWIKYSEYCFNLLGYSEYFILITTLSWSLLRCCSYAFNRADKQNQHSTNFSVSHFLGYTLYFPNLVYGPYIGYQRYVAILKVDTERSNLLRKCINLCWDLLRVAFWWWVLHVALHFFYIHYMERDVAAVQLVTPAFRRHAVGYFMGQFFFLYYVVTYGLGIALARFDGLNAPNRPRCIGCIHFYSDMWKYFDEGLYEFLFRHIYAQLCGKKSALSQKLFATAVTFAFVFIWHGCYTYVLIWSVLNFGCLVAEKCFKALTSMHFFKSTLENYFGKGGAERFCALLATQIFIPAAFSNVYFISGKEVGDCLMKGAYMNGIWNYLALTFSSYCFFQCAEVLKK